MWYSSILFYLVIGNIWVWQPPFAVVSAVYIAICRLCGIANVRWSASLFSIVMNLLCEDSIDMCTELMIYHVLSEAEPFWGHVGGALSRLGGECPA